MKNRHAFGQLLDYLDDVPAVVLTGPRQVGKTTLAKSIVSLNKKSTHYLDLEFPEDLAKLQNPTLFLEALKSDCVILDEIHHKPEIFPVLRALIDRNRVPGRYILLGSASPKLLRDSSESLAGRVAYLRMYPFSLLEIGHKVDWKTLFVRGGFPETLLKKTDILSLRWRVNFINTYTERELPLLGLGTSNVITRKLLHLIAHAQGQLLNIENISNALGVSRPTVRKCINYMEQSYIITVLNPWFTNVKKRLVKSPKVYIADSGLYHALFGLENFQSVLLHPQIGLSWEGFVINQTQSVLPEGYNLWFFRTHEGAEADIVITKNETPIVAAEIKWSNAPTLSKGFSNVISYLKTKNNFIITPESDTYPVEVNISVTSIKSWLEFVKINL
ncbi:MAG: ATP-binding protein [Cryomorphaceae bacterium]|nr:ATP-binding protein [Cryomorphaceae bacterium]